MFNAFSVSPKNIMAHLQNDVSVYVFDTIDSTNNEAKRMLESGFRGKALIISETQTSGRGRLGRSFYSPRSTGLYLTLIIPPILKDTDISLLTPAAAVAVTRVLSGITEKDLKIKWVNDIYADDKKICGILAEAVADIENGGFAGFAVGIGINLDTRDFPDDIANIADSLRTPDTDRARLAAEIANKLFDFAEKLSEKEFLPEYRSRSYVTDKDIYFIKHGEKTNAHAIGIDDDGGLIVKLENGDITVLRGGEISIRLNKEK